MEPRILDPAAFYTLKKERKKKNFSAKVSKKWNIKSKWTFSEVALPHGTFPLQKDLKIALLLHWVFAFLKCHKPQWVFILTGFCNPKLALCWMNIWLFEVEYTLLLTLHDVEWDLFSEFHPSSSEKQLPWSYFLCEQILQTHSKYFGMSPKTSPFLGSLAQTLGPSPRQHLRDATCPCECANGELFCVVVERLLIGI